MSGNAKKAILEFLVKANRPHSAQEVTTNLENKLGKTAVVNALDELANEKKINEKVYGKQKVYMALQNVDTSDIKAKLRDLDEKIILTSSELNRLAEDNRRTESEIQKYEETVPLSQLRGKLSELNEEVRALNDRLDNLKKENIKPITKEEKSKLQKDNEKYAKEWRKLKRITNDMINAILDNSSMKKKQLCEDLDLIMDEDLNVQPPTIK